jgi:hypothetical protein
MTKREQQTDARQQEGIAAETTDQQGGTTVKHLYRVTSKINGVYHYDCYDDVTISWFFCEDREYPLVHPNEGVQGYDQLDQWEKDMTSEALNELFSEDEARALVKYLSTCDGFTKTYIKAVVLPLPQRTCSYRALLDSHWSGRPYDTLVPAGYYRGRLPFEVNGFYDVGGMEPRKPKVCPTCGQEVRQVMSKNSNSGEEGK